VFTDIDFAAGLADQGIRHGKYLIKIASNDVERKASQRLRYLVFNEELGEGIAENSASGLDVDDFDSICDHLLIYKDDDLVGTYRLLSGMSKPAEGFYTQTEFELGDFHLNFEKAAEIGRVCIRPDARKRVTLMVLFWGLRTYLTLKRAQYLFGCGSLAKMTHDDAEATYQQLCSMGVVDFPRGVGPHSKNTFQGTASRGVAKIPPLVAAYLDFGARILGRPAYDPVFGCHDLLILLDIDHITERGRNLLEKFSLRSDKSESAV